MPYIQPTTNSSKVASILLKIEIIKPTKFHQNAFISFVDGISGERQRQTDGRTDGL
jgi:hypothetical protein